MWRRSRPRRRTSSSRCRGRCAPTPRRKNACSGFEVPTLLPRVRLGIANPRRPLDFRSSRQGGRERWRTSEPGHDMAVYTDVAADELAEFLSRYDIGELLSYKGIAEGVENSNFLLHTSSGYFILTLYEKRVARSNLPFFLELMTHLASRGISCPQPLKNKSGEALSVLAGRPAAIINFLEGVWPRKPNAAHCAGVGQALAKMHLAGADFAMARANALSVSGWRPLFDTAA